ncbi:hypothetical protein KIPB_013480 [Kipferlia bialata]|uniref:Uncharacterized protein n=1 Tax=Kipferlia bialata TaxID=797122 RepID=A0A9K3D9J7_9EUKA|nr:hypothetical protein KIPB_013480 [Kipferlia bialata]|eukprot:g13480.t1
MDESMKRFDRLISRALMSDPQTIKECTWLHWRGSAGQPVHHMSDIPPYGSPLQMPPTVPNPECYSLFFAKVGDLVTFSPEYIKWEEPLLRDRKRVWEIVYLDKCGSIATVRARE